MDDNGILTMEVKPGSKPNNLLPFALRAFGAPSCRKVIWQSLHGATGKTVACAEQFKRFCFSKEHISEIDKLNSNSQHNFEELFQSSRIFLQKRDVTLVDAGLQYTLEEAAITIVISKDPISDDSSSERITPGGHCNKSLNTTSSTEDKTLSRKRLKHTKKRKRVIPQGDPEKKWKKSKKGKSGSVSLLNEESSDPGVLSFPSPRLASAMEAVKKINSEMHT